MNDSATQKTIAIIGAGNIGCSIAEGLVKSRKYKPGQIILTRKQTQLLSALGEKGFLLSSDNSKAVSEADIIILAVRPAQTDELLQEIGAGITNNKIVISVITDVALSTLYTYISPAVPVIRAMPNIAIAIRESMTCLSTLPQHKAALLEAVELFNLLGATLIIDEQLMVPATVLGACGVAYFLRAIRAASQGGIQIGFHADDALHIAAQTAKGAAELLLKLNEHPESAIDKVTTPRGCTIAGLNEMEHEGFSASMIKGILRSFEQAENLYAKHDKKQ